MLGITVLGTAGAGIVGARLFNSSLPLFIITPTLLAVFVIFIVISVRRLRSRLARERRCLTCGYSLIGTPVEDDTPDLDGGGRCPECGRWFHPLFYEGDRRAGH